MKTISIALAGAAAMALALPAAAQLNRPQLSSVYVGGSIGQSKFKDACNDVSGPGVSCDDKDTAWRLLAGYQFNRYFAAEVGYHDLGKISGSGPGTNAEIKANAWELVGLGTFPLGSQFGVYGKLGAYRGETKASGNVLGIGFSGKDTNTGATYGAGLQWDAIRNLGLRLEWQRYHDIGGDNTGKGDIDVVGLGAIWRFQ